MSTVGTSSTLRGGWAVCNEIPPLIGQSAAMCRLAELITRVGIRDCTVLIEGESGTGKELVARHLHGVSPRRARPFVAVDCANLHDSLMESQLFGHVRGAFTGAHEDGLGFLRAADGGTLFLDEIGELPPRAQARLLRSLQERTVVPLGSVIPVPVDVRLIAATHRDLRARVRRGRFREDLYYRLEVARLEVPALRTRREDIRLLAAHFLLLQAELYGEPPRGFSVDALAVLEGYHWPGNVRELANAVEHAYVFSPDQQIAAEYLPADVTRPTAPNESAAAGGIVSLATAERALISRALRVANGCQARAAELLQIERRRLYRKVRKYGLQDCVKRQRVAY